MGRFPKIDQPCPLGMDAQKRVDGYCMRCEKNVHSLDALTPGERESLLQSASDSICVSYHVPAPRRTARFGAAIALAMVVLPVAAADVVPKADASHAESAAPASALSDALHPPEVKCHDGDPVVEDNTPLPDEMILLTGGVSHPGDAEWVDSDDSLPDLPRVVERAGRR